MSDHSEFQNVVVCVSNATDPVQELRGLVLAAGGHWANANHNALFEINFLGIGGLGFGAAAAVANWIDNAERTNAVGSTA